jgi:hypothetical protein
MYARFSLENNDQVEMLDSTEKTRSHTHTHKRTYTHTHAPTHTHTHARRSTMQAACAWLTSSEHSATWREGWIPKDEFACDAGQYVVADGSDARRCAACPKGSRGLGGKATSCTACDPGLCSAAWSVLARGVCQNAVGRAGGRAGRRALRATP